MLTYMQVRAATHLQVRSATPCELAGMEEALRRKDTIIRVRNAQISALWDELHTRQPWKNALGNDGRPIVFAGPAENTTSKALAVLGINTVRRTAHA